MTKNPITLNCVDMEVLDVVLKDIEAYYRSEPFKKCYNLAQIGAKMMGVHRLRRVLGLEVETPQELIRKGF